MVTTEITSVNSIMFGWVSGMIRSVGSQLPTVTRLSARLDR